MTWSLINIEELSVRGTSALGVSAHLEKSEENSNEEYQLFYTGNGGVTVNTMSNDVQLTEQGVIRLIQDLTIITTTEGRRRAYYIEIDPNSGNHEIFTALISEDGLTLSQPTTTGISDNGDTAWGVPDSVVLPDGRIRLYWVSSDWAAKTLANEVILSATSTTAKGTNFVIDEGYRTEGGYVDFEVLKADDNNWLAIMSSSPVTIPDEPQGIYIGVSNDGLIWEINSNNLAPTEKSYLDPTGVLLSSSNDKYKIVMSSSLSILGDREYSLVAAELKFTSSSESSGSDSSLNMVLGKTDLLTGISDYDGNVHGYLGEAPENVKTAYKYQGKLDVNADGIIEAIYTNKESGRWITASIDPITGGFDYTKHGVGGTTRIVGIYEDPLVTAGLVEKDSVFDGSRTFINDLKLDNLILKTVGDFDSDGFQEVYWSKVDNTAYLRAVMHADGNIQYANYQNLDQMTDYLTGHGFADTIALIA